VPSGPTLILKLTYIDEELALAIAALEMPIFLDGDDRGTEGKCYRVSVLTMFLT
jgi:hypothetical protein